MRVPRIQTAWWIAAVVFIAAAGLRLYAAHPPLRAYEEASAVLLLGVPYAALMIRLRISADAERQQTIQQVATYCNLGLCAAFLGALAPWLDDLPAVAFALFSSVIITADIVRRRRDIQVGAGIVMIVLGLYWIGVNPEARSEGGVSSLLVWTGFLVGLSLLVHESWLASGMALSRKLRQLDATSSAARMLGLATDEPAVTRAIVTASKAAYPGAEYVALMAATPDGDLRLLDDDLDLDRTPSVAAARKAIVLKPGESFAGQAFVSGIATFVPDLNTDANFPPQVKAQLERQGLKLRSVIAAPLTLPDRGVIGVLSLSSLKPGVWDAEDIAVVQGLADQAALGLERVRLYDEQIANAITDSLTGLSNRRHYEDVMTQELARAKRSKSGLAIVFCDLDRFKTFNDRLGHAAGDRVLRLFAETVKSVLRAEDTPARLGGDEFVIVLPGASEEQAQVVASRLRTEFAAAIELDPRLAAVGTSVTSGWAAYPADGTTAPQLLKTADTRLLKAKRGGKAPRAATAG